MSSALANIWWIRMVLRVASTMCPSTSLIFATAKVTYRLMDWHAGFTLQAQKALQYLLKDAKESDKKKPTITFHWKYECSTAQPLGTLLLAVQAVYILSPLPMSSATWVSGEVIEIIDNDEDDVVVSN
ncbi:hypothetical protein DFH08DRAFT_807438 [Mycena albidolilacea]|uniref:Uncharacterized protein n=1 Tax=Mycena albidolilacea TaxID=1033008 RepID=A0AAD7ESN8_9AGAR|nr:hypothetical protein DFH08DRAFT_807438 [Mycena albidolilacea]